jgi:methionyl-tRNA formyltransferase
VTALRILFLGTPAFAVPSLSALASSPHAIAGVVTQPDRRRGRGQHVVPEAVKQEAIARGLPVLQPARLSDPATQDAIAAMDADIGVVVAYGKILSAEVLAMPRLGFINVHASLLPRWRGAAPVHRAILAGDTRTGVTIMRVVQALDAGPILMAEETEIGEGETSAELSERLATMGAALVVRAVDGLAAGRLLERPQDEAAATYAKRLDRSEGRLDWTLPARRVHNQIRGLQPWPMAAAMLGGTRVALLRSAVLAETGAPAPPGTITDVRPDALDVACGAGLVRLTELQPEGRRAMTVRSFLAGHRPATGDRFLPLPAGAG